MVRIPQLRLTTWIEERQREGWRWDKQEYVHPHLVSAEEQIATDRLFNEIVNDLTSFATVRPQMADTLSMRLTEAEYESLTNKKPIVKPVPPLDGQRLVFGISPSINHLYATVMINGRPRRVLSKVGREYKATTAAAAKKQGVIMLEGEVRLTIRIFRARKVGDTENFCKSLIDALNGVAYRDDAQITELHAYRFDDRDNPRIEVEIKGR